MGPVQITHPFSAAPTLTLGQLSELLLQNQQLILQKDDYVSLRFYLNGKEQAFELEDFFNALKQHQEEFLAQFPYSWRLTNIQNLHSEIKENCRELSLLKGGAITCNLYFTPGAGRNCFLYHSDPQDSFVYQLQGTKRWSFALDDSDYVKDVSLSHKSFENRYGQSFAENKVFEMIPGSFMEIPYGLVHKAEIQDQEPSTHLNFAMTYPTRLEFTQFVFGALATPWGLEEKGYERLTDQDIQLLALELTKLMNISGAEDFIKKFQLLQFKKAHAVLTYGRSYAHRFQFGIR